MKKNWQYFFYERAKNLAIIHLTRRSDLNVNRMISNYDAGLDLLVTILRDDVPTGRIFGVQVKGYTDVLKDVQNSPLLFSEEQIDYLLDLPFPICVFLFSMDDDRGYYIWPKSFAGGSAQIALSIEQDRLCSLDNEAIHQIVEDVNSWYDTKRNAGVHQAISKN